MYRECWKKAREEGLREAELLQRVSECLRIQAEAKRRLGEATE